MNLLVKQSEGIIQDYVGHRRYYSLDRLKIICAFLVVCIHAPLPGVTGEYFMTLTRIAVPIFLMISEFFYAPKSASKLIKRVFIYMVVANLFYFLLHLSISLLQSRARAFFTETFTVDNAFSFLIFNESPFHVHLWYLGCILYVYIFVRLLETCFRDFKRVQVILYIISPILLFSDLVFGKYSILLFGHEFRTLYIRNWIFVGLPYFVIGMLMRQYRETICKTLIKLGKVRMILLIMLFALTTCIEHFFLVKAGANATRDHYISTTLLAMTLFGYCMVFDNESSFFSRIGRQYSTWIYIFHPLFIIFWDAVIGRIGGSWYFYIRPFIVYMTVIIVIWFISRAYRIIVKRL